MALFGPGGARVRPALRGVGLAGRAVAVQPVAVVPCVGQVAECPRQGRGWSYIGVHRQTAHAGRQQPGLLVWDFEMCSQG